MQAGQGILSRRLKIKRLTLERRKKENLRNAAQPQTGERTLSKKNGRSVQERLTTYSRAYTANTCICDPGWMKGKDSTELSVSPLDTERLGVSDGVCARLVTKRGDAEVTVQISDRMREGTLSLPNGLGLAYPDEEAKVAVTGVAPNELTGTGECDPWAKTPWHKYVHARLEAL